MNKATTRLRVFADDGDSPRNFRTAISLHCHTHHSKENLGFIPHYAARIPFVSVLLERELNAYATLNDKPIDFASAYWTPPLTERMVFARETAQIEERLGLHSLVSITDHDTIEAGLHLQVVNPMTPALISTEWTVPYQHGFFHLGIHNLPADRATAIMNELAAYTAQPEGGDLHLLLEMLNDIQQTLVVFNHPLWDIEMIGTESHQSLLQQFVDEYGQWIHAFEVNGFRSWRENRCVLEMAKHLGFPVVAGGDSHGCEASTTLNVTRAADFAEFAAEVRVDRISDIMLMPEYYEPLPVRTLESVASALRFYPQYPSGQQRWTDRVFVQPDEDGIVRPLSYYWKRGGPRWVRATLCMMRLLGSRRLRPALRLATSNVEGLTL